MKEFRHRTDLLNAQAICFLFGLTDTELQEMRASDFPEPEHYRMVKSPYPHQSPKRVVYWRRPAVETYMATVCRQRKDTG